MFIILVHEAIRIAEDTYKCVVKSVVTDGAANMVKLQKNLANSTDHVIFYTCASHSGNLVAKYICRLPRYKEILDQTTQIAKYFTYHHLPSGWYRDNGGLKLKIPKAIRWNTYSDHLKSFLDNHNVLLKICIEYEGHSSLDQDIGKY